MSLNISYGETATFFCSVREDHRGGPLYWKINGLTDNPRATLDKDGYQTWNTVSKPIRTSTLYVNGSLYANNNLQIRCVVLHILSSIAILKINGNLEHCCKIKQINFDIIIIMYYVGLVSSMNVSVPLRTENFIDVQWRKPAMYIDVHNYSITIINMAAAGMQRNVTVNGSMTEYRYVPGERDDYCSLLRFCVLSVRFATVGDISGCITTSVKRGI